MEMEKISDNFVLRNLTIVEPKFMKTYSWEKIDINFWRNWIAKHFWVVVLIGIFYLAVIYFGKIYMKNRAPYKLTRTLVLWNLSLSIFSFLAVTRTFPELYHTVVKKGFYHTLCVRGDISHASAFWGLAFLISKVIELGDTFFLIARKKPIIFLHWYHHLTVLTCAFYYYPNYDIWATWGAIINATIHTFMYAYYALMASGIKVPRRFAMAITVMQLIQFLYTILIVSFIIAYKALSGFDCDSESQQLYMALAVIGSYFILFARFFHQAYMNEMKRKIE